MALFSNLSQRLAKSATGRMLGSLSSLVQVIAIVGGALWGLYLYLHFQMRDEEATKRLRQIAIDNAIGNRLEAHMHSDVVRIFRYHDDDTFLYRYYVSLELKNITQVPVFVPALTVEFFVGAMPREELKPNDSLYVNLPSHWRQKTPVDGRVVWTPDGAFARTLIDPCGNPDLNKQLIDFSKLPKFSKLPVDFGGTLQPQETTDIGLTFMIRARPQALAGSVITYWDQTENCSTEREHFDTNHELLIEARDARAPDKDESSSSGPDRDGTPK